jgi:hypothetical protein
VPLLYSVTYTFLAKDIDVIYLLHRECAATSHIVKPMRKQNICLLYYSSETDFAQPEFRRERDGDYYDTLHYNDLLKYSS